jgi:hypothetical protein
MRALPTRAKESRQFPGAETPVDPRKDDAADEKEEERAWQEVFHVRRRSFGAVI